LSPTELPIQSCSTLRTVVNGPSISKRLIVRCDGTWYAADKGADDLPSNVARMSRMIASEGINEKGEKVPQVVYYLAGVGTGYLGWVEKRWQGMCVSISLMVPYHVPG